MRNIINICIVFFTFSIMAQTEKPNVLLIMTDQHAFSALSCVGNTDLNTPNIDKIAKGGTIFNKTYVTFPLCTPSRASMFTGKMPHELGIYSNLKVNLSHESFKNGLGELMQANGYDCVYGGKWHLPEISIPSGVGFENIANSGDDGLAESCVSYLEKEKKQPFFMVASFVNPHDICEYARGQRLPNGEIEKLPAHNCPNLPLNHAIGPYDSEILRLEQKFNSSVYPTTKYSDDDWRQYLSAYYKLVEKVDFEIGKVLQSLEDTGLDKNTIIIFTSDHGDGMSAHHWNQKTVLYDEAAKVPLIVKNPSLKKQQATSNQLVSIGLDLMPSILEIGGVNAPKNLRGVSFLKGLKNDKNAKRKSLVIETMFDGKNALGTKGRAFVDMQYKYVIYEQGKNREQLFDLKNDPLEMTNLAKNSKYNKQRNKMREQLYNWAVDNKDMTVMKRLLVY